MATFRVSGTQSCGIVELADVSSLPSPEAIVKATAVKMAEYMGFHRNPAFLMFSGVVAPRAKVYDEVYHANRSDDYGTALAEYIKAEGFGEVTETPAAKNHSGNMLRVWLWAPNWDALKAVYIAQRGY